jgi:uncharacterized SAM-binding protein YcdF (DUF218 family)
VDSGLVIRAVLKSLILPPAGPLLWVIAGLYWSRYQRLSGRVLWLAGIGSLLLLSLPVVADGLVLWAGRTRDASEAAPAPAAIVVLSGGIRINAGRYGLVEGADVRAVTLLRLAAGATLARRTGLPILVSGGRVEPGPPEAAVMAAVLQQAFGLTPQFLEDRSRNTRENAVESARLLRAAGVQSVFLVTSAVHMPRAAQEFREAGLTVRPYPVAGPESLPHGVYAWLPHPWALEESYAALYEWLGRALKAVVGHD